MKKIALLVMFTLSTSVFAEGFLDFIFPKTKYEHENSKPILDTLFGNDMRDKIPKRGKISVNVQKNKSDGSFNSKYTSTSYLYPANLDSCGLLINVMESFYSKNKPSELKLKFVGLETSIMKSLFNSNKTNSGQRRMVYKKGEELEVILSRNFLKENRKQLDKYFSYCAAKMVSQSYNGKKVLKEQFEHIQKEHSKIDNSARKHIKPVEAGEFDLGPESGTRLITK
ncbi:hypothetical protein A9Q84_17420 [Halobacteriovorax marinus]|uniref:Secreted protein n=1 Tax=Halobacteriovorax marinus TaxID=97084 RepID=A0A1Y5F319_9BACT|nr:hypothetical protein A9Q84_17420 [Halobacteriovorax marinus]